MASELHAGHRQRMRDKFLRYGRDVFHTHELLEMLLFEVVPYKNTNDIAKNLIARFSSLDGVLSASREQLLSVNGVGPKTAELLVRIGSVGIGDFDSPVNKDLPSRFDDYREVGRFFADYFENANGYEVAALFLNNKLEYLNCETLYQLDYASGAVNPRPFLERAIQNRATVMILAHNHPYGPTYPTPSDIATNAFVASTLEGAGISVLEHYIISGKTFVGFMKNLRAAFSQYPEIYRFIESKEAER
jgi:DNA repair protein RadC